MRLLLFLTLSIQFILVALASGQQNVQQEPQLGLSYILTLAGIQKDLDMTEEQANDLSDLHFDVRDSLQSEVRKLARNTSPKLPAKKQLEIKKEFETAVEKIRDDETKRIEAVLLPHQIKRLREIRFQHLRRSHTGLEAMASDLELSGTQISKISELNNALQTEVRNLSKSARTEGMTRATFAERVIELRQQLEEDLLAVLTPAQQKKLKEFDFVTRKKKDDQKIKDKQN